MSGFLGMKRAKSIMRQSIYHRLFDCRGVMLEHDQFITGIVAWYDRGEWRRSPEHLYRYHILVHGENHETCVAERNRVEDNTRGPVHHFVSGDSFVNHARGIYYAGRQTN